MSFASDKLYNGYLRRNMPTIVSKVKVREIIVHLPCLTTHDRENIEAKRETNGNYDGMVLLLECLRRRENWPEQFIKALEECEQTTIAADIRAEYDTLRGVNNSNPSSPSTTVIRAHVHPAPSASHLPIPESAGAAAVTPAEASAPPEPAAQASPLQEPPVQPEAQNSAAEQAVPPPEPVPVPPQATQIEVVPPPSTPPPSPEIPHTPASTPQREVNAHQEPEENSESDIQNMSNKDCAIPDQLSTREAEVLVDSVVTPPPCELDQPVPLQTTATTEVAGTPPEKVKANQEPEENSESDIQDISGDNVVIPDQVSAEKSEVVVSSVVTPPRSPCETDTDPDTLRTTAASEVSPPQSTSPTQANSDISNGSSFPILTPEKHPVQDTTPPEDIIPADVLEPEAKTEPPIIQVVESSPQTETASTNSPLPEADRMDASITDYSTLSLNKPEQLISVQPQNDSSPTLVVHSLPAGPYSGDSERLEISDAAPDDTVPACSAVTSTTMNTVSGLPCLENGIALNHDEPGENHCESLCQSLEGQEVQVNVVHVSEEPSILNLDGQVSAPQAQLINGEAAREITPSPPSATTDENPASDQSCLPPESAEITPELKTLPDSEEESAPRTSPTNRKYILTAAGVGACALLMAWKFKN